MRFVIRAAVAAIALSGVASFGVSIGAEAAPKVSHQSTEAVAASPSTVTWGAPGSDVVTITGSGFGHSTKLYIELAMTTGQFISGVLPVTASSTGSFSAQWELNDPYNCSQVDPPSYSGDAEALIMNKRESVIASAPFTILPGDNTETC